MAPAFTYHIDLLEVNCSALQPIGHGLYSGLNRRRKPRAQRTFVVSFTPYALVRRVGSGATKPWGPSVAYMPLPPHNYASRRANGCVRFV